ncbi:MAG: hypothetical protein FD130_1342 [Halothiobacillaceae bacterium]|nr:MAG: hypothetical protein FD130_1342 [Halothiobacillaceae bacterium]
MLNSGVGVKLLHLGSPRRRGDLLCLLSGYRQRDGVAMDEGWLKEHIEAIMYTIGLFSLVGVAAIIIAYLMIKARLKKKRSST